jgi:pimeloyl-ACP methyl ester carboxylesterase
MTMVGYALHHVPAVKPVHRSRYINVDGVRTHYLEAGDGPTVVLLHSGEFGGAAEISWEYLIPLLAPHFRVVAPDWLGFGRTDKVHDFESKSRRMFQHLVRFCEVMAIDKAHFVGNSMGGTFLLKLAAETPCRLPIDRLVAVSGGGFVPDNEHRRSLLAYDGTSETMKDILKAIFVDPVWWEDEAYVARRVKMSLLPGAWEAVAAARFRSPATPERSEFGALDATPYEAIAVPTLLIVGARDRLREAGYAEPVRDRVPYARIAMLPDAGHCPNIENADAVADIILSFLQTSGN